MNVSGVIKTPSRDSFSVVDQSIGRSEGHQSLNHRLPHGAFFSDDVDPPASGHTIPIIIEVGAPKSEPITSIIRSAMPAPRRPKNSQHNQLDGSKAPRE